MTVLFRRDWAVRVDTLLVDGLRIVFKAEKNLLGFPNTLDLKVFNLAAATRAQMRTRYAQVVVQVGYGSGANVPLENVFSGDARTIDHVRSGATWETHVQCGDGEKQYRGARVNLSFGPGSSFVTIASAIAKSMGLNLGNSIAQINAKGAMQFAQGYSAAGVASRELEKVLAAAGLKYSIQDGALQVLDETATTSNAVVVLNSKTGMIGSPDHETPEHLGLPAVLKVRSLMNPQIKPGGRIQVQDATVAGSGIFRVMKVTHQGDTHGNDWFSDVEARPM